MTELDAQWRAAHPIPASDEGADKRSRGHLTVVGGSPQTPGALLLAGTAGLRVGAGRLNLVTVPECLAGLAMQRQEARVYPYLYSRNLRRLRGPCLKADALVLGPGVLCGRLLRGALDEFLSLPIPLVLDALALHLVQGRQLQSRPAPTVLTPHQRELSVLLGEEVTDPPGDAQRLARLTGAIVVAKGPEACIAAAGSPCWRPPGEWDPDTANEGRVDMGTWPGQPLLSEERRWTMTNLLDRNEILTIFKGISQDVQTLVRQEGMLLRAELKEDATQVAKVGGEMALGGAVVAMGSLLLVLAVVFALSWLFPELPLWGSCALVGSVLLMAGGVLVARARAKARQLDLTPRQTLRSVKKDLRVLAPGT
ncbi:MAG: phage holin family protein [Candidatus Eremiobacteraeota bacterium]|nr:phage holin family protein [Candidatus Eremiobacteraeota bacterium]MCW5867159.1 phage holin family protein [Candidatus Eremiobacteraeota bacterium]